VAIDPELGRLAFPPGHPPHGVWVSYHYGFSSDIGGGEYPAQGWRSSPQTLATPMPMNRIAGTEVATEPIPACSTKRFVSAVAETSSRVWKPRWTSGNGCAAPIPSP